MNREERERTKAGWRRPKSNGHFAIGDRVRAVGLTPSQEWAYGFKNGGEYVVVSQRINSDGKQLIGLGRSFGTPFFSSRFERA